MGIGLKSNKVFIIAEAGVNHNGSIELAYKLIDVAFESGADAIKFQTFKAENLGVIKNDVGNLRDRFSPLLIASEYQRLYKC